MFACQVDARCSDEARLLFEPMRKLAACPGVASDPLSSEILMLDRLVLFQGAAFSDSHSVQPQANKRRTTKHVDHPMPMFHFFGV